MFVQPNTDYKFLKTKTFLPMFHAFCETFITINYQIMKNTDLVRFGDLNRRRNIDFLLLLCF